MKKKKQKSLNFINMNLIIKINQKFDETLVVKELENTFGEPIVFTREDIGNYVSNELGDDGQLYAPFYFEENGASGRCVLVKTDAGTIHMKFDSRRIRIECYDSNGQVDMNAIFNDGRYFHLPEIRLFAND
jgi:hypothetical protein